MSDFEQKDETGVPEAAASVDKIRDILFGSQIKNYEARFARLEENLVRETVELKESMQRRFDSVEGFFRSETETLAARLRAEREERTHQAQALDRDMKSADDELGRKIHQLDASTADAHSGLRKELMAESHKLIEEIGQRYDRLRALLESRVGELRQLKTDRMVLAALLADMATKIGEDSQPDQPHSEHSQSF